MVIRNHKKTLVSRFGTGFILKKNLGSFATMGFGSSWVCFDFDFDFDLFVVDGSVEAD